MPLVSNDLAYLQTRFTTLQAKLKERTAQQALPMSEGVAYGRSDQFIAALHVELRNVAAQLVALKWDPILIVATMESVHP